MLSFGGDNVAITLSEDGTSYTIKSALNEKSLVNITFTRVVPGVVIGKNGTSNFGTDPANPWGSMRHAFWPQCKVEGSIITPEREIDCTGRGFFVYALQGMKPHHLGTSFHLRSLVSYSHNGQLRDGTSPVSMALRSLLSLWSIQRPHPTDQLSLMSEAS